ncbi:MAG: PKD domain-containing protein, partial [Bacteroidales bacterium]|nr:PKD domain-containing protein [Bacteroidales bacterium]
MKRIFTRSFIIIVFLFSGILLQAQSSTFKPGIVLTWDDRAVDEWHDIIPILNKYSAVTTFFISEPFYITESQMDSLVDLINAGYEIGSHGWAHLDGPDYVANNSYEAYINDEILPSLQWAKDSFNVDVTSFAYPFGSFSYALNDTLYYNKYFNVLRATAATDVYQPVDLYRPYIDEYNRNGIVWGVGIDSSYGNTLDELKAAFLKTKNENSVLVLYGHDPVEDPNYDYQTKLSTLDSLLSYAHSLDLEFYTAKNLGGIIESNNTYTPDYFINVGGSHIYNGGHHWIPEADNIFHGGNTTSNSFSIENTIEDTIFNSARYGNLTYEIPLGNGDFDVNLYFAETYFVEGGGGGPGIGRRVFNVYIEGVRVLENFDINAESQVDVPYAIIRTFPVSISDSILNIEFESLTDNAILSGMTIQATGNQDNSPPAALLQSFSIFGNAPLTSNFDASLSYDPVGAISNYSWTFADGSTGNGPTINHTYNTAGVYKVELLVTDDGGLTDTAWVNVTVLTTNEPPVAVAEALPVAGNAPLEVTFIGGASTDDNDTISSYSWDFADGNTGEGDTIVHTFTAEGTYHVELVITDNGGLTDTTFVDITVSPNEPPVASAEATPLTGDAPLDVDFDASASNDPDGSIESYAWDFDDGNTGTGEILSHTFNTPGDYQVEVVITDNGGLTDTARIDITVNVPNQPPVASAEATPTTGHAALDVDFDASASNDPDGTIITYAWDFDDGNTGTGIAVSHTFLTQGDYHVELVVTDNEGLTDTLWIDINVTAPNLPPVASAEAAPVSGDYPLEVSFDGSASTDSDGTISSYAWDFDDGSTGTGETVTHSYLTQGIYEAVLTVTDDDGATDTDTVEISVTEPVPFIEVISPNGGEQLQVGTLFDITWTSFGTSGNVHIEYSVTNGSAWSDVIASTPDNGLYSWTIPNDPSFECLIRISDTDANPTDQSNAIFRISSDPPLHFVPVWINNGQDHMNFYAKTAKIEGLDMQSGDEIGIFDGIYCIGSGRITEVLNGTTSILDIRVSKDDLGTPEADGYTPGHIANFRIWDSINQREIVNVEITFDSGSDTLKVGESAWFHINGVNQVTQNISLQNGWNIFSLYVIPENISMLNIVQPLIDQNRLVKVQNESGASIEQIPNTTTWINQIGNWNI